MAMSDVETGSPEKRFSVGAAWFAVTVGVFLVVIGLEAWTTVYPYDAQLCAAAPQVDSLNHYVEGLLVMLLFAGVLGVVAARGWRLWFAGLLIVGFIEQSWFILHGLTYLPSNCS